MRKKDILTYFFSISARYLVKHCSDLDINARNNNGQTVAHIVTAYGCKESLEYLIKLGNVDFEVHDQWRMTPLHYACRQRCNNYRNTNMLLKRIQPDVNAQTTNGWPFDATFIMRAPIIKEN